MSYAERELLRIFSELTNLLKASLLLGEPRFTIGFKLVTSKRVLKECLKFLGYSLEQLRIVKRIEGDLYEIPFPQILDLLEELRVAGHHHRSMVTENSIG